MSGVYFLLSGVSSPLFPSAHFFPFFGALAQRRGVSQGHPRKVFLSRLRYWIASETSAVETRSRRSRSAMDRETFKIRLYARAERPRVSSSNSAFPEQRGSKEGHVFTLASLSRMFSTVSLNRLPSSIRLVTAMTRRLTPVYPISNILAIAFNGNSPHRSRFIALSRTAGRFHYLFHLFPKPPPLPPEAALMSGRIGSALAQMAK